MWVKKLTDHHLWRLLNSKPIKFLCTGILNTFFGYGTYIVLLFLGTPYLLALLASTIAGVLFNYHSFGSLVFERRKDRHVFSRFVLAYFLIYCVNAILLKLLVEYFSVTPYFGQVICLPVSVVVSWYSMNYWVYKKEGSPNEEKN